ALQAGCQGFEPPRLHFTFSCLGPLLAASRRIAAICRRHDLPPALRRGDIAPRAIKADQVSVTCGQKEEVGTTELESVTSCMSSKRSNQLSYAPSVAAIAKCEFAARSQV